MAFVGRSDKNSYTDVAISQNVPGPGTYMPLREYQPPKGYAPFLSTADRSKPLKKDDEAPGPGSYNISLDMTGSNQAQKLLVSSLNPDPREFEVPKLSNVFKSKTQRFTDKATKNIDTPGPGSYYKEMQMGKNIKMIPGSYNAHKDMVENLLKMNKHLSIPSIPSNLHGYGYTENDGRELILNKNPLMDAFKLVGPGYYNHRPGFEGTKTKGPSWHRSGVKRFGENKARSVTADNVGPGAYDLQAQYVPLYKMKQSAGFASSTKRAMEAKSRPYNPAKTMMDKSYRSAHGYVDERMVQNGGMDEPHDMEEYIDNSTPGPGYYHNESIASSIKAKYKPERLQFFGTSSERFKEIEHRSNPLGPGDYDISKSLNIQKNINGKAPFTSSNVRFDKMAVMKTPGPGSYEPQVSLRNKLEKKVKHGYQGNFGSTDRRFKANSQIEDLPGPGSYVQIMPDGTQQSVFKPTAVFASSSKRETYSTKRGEMPAPNSYNMENYSLARTIIKEEDEDPELSPKKAPFNTTQARFKEAPKLDPEEEEAKQIPTKTIDSVIKSKIKPKPNAVFASGSRRTGEGRQGENPGPGSYHDPNNTQWNKRTYNILFAEV